MYLTACCLLEAAAEHVLGGDGLVLRDLVAVLAGIVAVVLDFLTALRVMVGIAAGRRRAGLGAFQLVPIVVVIVELRHLVDLDRGLWRVFDVDADNARAVD